MDSNGSSVKSSGGFRVVVNNDLLVVERDLTAFDKPARRRRLAVLCLGIALSAMLLASEVFHQWKSSRSYSDSIFLNAAASAVSLLATGFPLGLVLAALFPISSAIRVSRQKLEIVCPRLMRKTRIIELQRTDVIELKFVDEGLGWFGLPAHICVIAKGGKFKCLQGIAAYEATKFIAECRRMESSPTPGQAGTPALGAGDTTTTRDLCL